MDISRIGVEAGPRLHFGLADLSGITPRRYGGAGVALDGPRTVLSAVGRSDLRIDGAERLDEDSRRDLTQVLNRVQERCGQLRAHLRIEAVTRPHVGLGSKTALLLSVIASLDRLLGWRLSVKEIQALSGRGGTSGIGIHSFFSGGFVVDGGHEAGSPTEPFRPSSAATGHDVPPLNIRLAVPEEWCFTLLLPDGVRVFGGHEREFFSRNTPIPATESLETLGLIYHGLVPAIRAGDLPATADSLSRMHSCGFKRIELNAQAAAVRRVYARLAGLPGVAAGLSSLGPLLFVIHHCDDTESTMTMSKVAGQAGVPILGTWRGNNSGAVVQGA